MLEWRAGVAARDGRAGVAAREASIDAPRSDLVTSDALDADT